MWTANPWAHAAVSRLVLEWNALGIWDEAFSLFCEGLSSNGVLTQLDLRNNQIDHHGAAKLALALKRNTSVQALGETSQTKREPSTLWAICVLPCVWSLGFLLKVFFCFLSEHLQLRCQWLDRPCAGRPNIWLSHRTVVPYFISGMSNFEERGTTRRFNAI